jgi:hypothetical protein
MLQTRGVVARRWILLLRDISIITDVIVIISLHFNIYSYVE